jgi:caffeoyl-CoA O-methyltransferase
MDINRQNYELGVPFLKKAGVLHKIDFREGKGISLLEDLLSDVSRSSLLSIINLFP